MLTHIHLSFIDWIWAKTRPHPESISLYLVHVWGCVWVSWSAMTQTHSEKQWVSCPIWASLYTGQICSLSVSLEKMTPAISLHWSLRVSMAPWMELLITRTETYWLPAIHRAVWADTRIEESALHLIGLCFSATWTHTCWASLIFFKFVFIYFWLCWVFVASRGHSLVVASGGYSLGCRLLTALTSLIEEHRLWGAQASVVVVHRL